MIWVFVSAILFGLVHPGSKFILDRGIGLLPFCLLYVGVRLIAQIPLVIKGGQWRIRSRTQLYTLLGLGVVGAALQFSEFAGIAKGLPVPLVTFLVYTHPVWTLLLSRLLGKEAISPATALKLCLAIAGIILITGAQWDSSYSLHSVIFPLAAGLMISLWITLSNIAVKKGCSSRTVSFYYDLFAFLLLCSIGFSNSALSPLSEAARFMASFPHALEIAFYSVVIGLIPNCLFYYGSASVSAVTAGFILLLEPVIAAGTSSLFWGDVLSPYFLLGGICILSTNIPASFFESLRRSLRVLGNRMIANPVRIAGALSLTFISPLLLGFSSVPKTIHLVEISPTSPTDYTSVREMKQFETAADFAISDYKKLRPQCSINIIRTLKRGTNDELFETVHKISISEPGSILVGLTTTNAARIGAKAASGTHLKAISIGASGIDFREINPNFVSIVSPWTRQWDALAGQMKTLGCTKENSLTIADPKNRMSTNFLNTASKAFEVSGVSEVLPANINERVSQKRCVFFALSYSESEKYLSELIKGHWQGAVIGTGDWNYYSEELTKTLESAHYQGLVTYVPTGWKNDASKRGKVFSERFKGLTGESAKPIAAYAYDGLMLALDELCQPANSLGNRLHRLPFLRTYEGVADTGNFLSKMYVIKRESRNTYAKE